MGSGVMGSRASDSCIGESGHGVVLRSSRAARNGGLTGPPVLTGVRVVNTLVMALCS